ncbi:MAG TPA: hypothetical protein VEY10_02100 [Flavisolibacter sp.]|nr:hypothetical protein [Flavisolibacter sp.]
MENRNEKRSAQEEKNPMAGDMPSFNNRDAGRRTQIEKAEEGKDESESYTDYNGNSEQNAPATNK